jgi:CelD/BcsL family acetyltransferase involved in cellulose biosynthesis
LRLVLHREIPDAPALREQWNSLVQQVERPQVFYTWEWAVAVQRAYGTTLHPLLFLGYNEQDSLCAIAALATNSEKTLATFLCATTGDYCDLLSSPGDKPAFVAAVLNELKKLGIGDIVLTNLPADSSSVPAIQQASRAHGYRFFARTAYVCTQVSLAHLERRPGENRPILPRKKMLRRFLNAMGRDAPVRLDHARSWDAVEPILPRFMQLHVARFLVTGRISNMARPERRRFLHELAKLLCDSGWLAVTRMMSGKTAYAWNYGFQFQDTWFWYQPTFDSALEKYSPGFCMLAKLIEESSDNPALKFVDLGLGDEEYKDRFSNRTRETLYVTLNSSTTQHYREVGRYRASELIRAIPKVETAARSLRQRWRLIRERNAQVGVRSTLGRAAKRAGQWLYSGSEVFFYEWSEPGDRSSKSPELQSLDLNSLASATMKYVDDDSTMAYMLRAADRLSEGHAEGFGLVDGQGSIVHLAWAIDFDGFFLSELNSKVDAPAPDCVMIFDCWTPPALRGHGYYGHAIAAIARQIRDQDKKPWIFSAASNFASVRGIESAGFQRRYSLTRRRAFGWQWIDGKAPAAMESPVTEVSARV